MCHRLSAVFSERTDQIHLHVVYRETGTQHVFSCVERVYARRSEREHMLSLCGVNK